MTYDLVLTKTYDPASQEMLPSQSHVRHTRCQGRAVLYLARN